MVEARAKRRLAAILAADVVGFSRLMEHDEAGTLSALKARRREVLAPLVTQHHGRLVKVMGDGVLVEFASAVDAVECAIEVQRRFTETNRSLPDPRRIVLRIGINLGDVIVEGSDLYGDGVNVATRLEKLAEPGSICVSGSVYDQVKRKLPSGFDDLGAQAVKNIAEPIHVYRVRQERNEPEHKPPILSDRPSIVVLAFENMSIDQDQEYFADGIAEDIITDLSKISSLFVIARNSAFIYKGKAVNLQKVGRELGVRYVLQGSVRKASNRVRITAQLTDASSGGHVWAERYDRELTDIFEVQDDVTSKIVVALKVHLTPDERRQVERRGTSSIEAHDRCLHGRQLFWQSTRESAEQSQRHFEEAIRLDPAFCLAHAYLALTHNLQSINGWSTELDGSSTRAQELVARALALDPMEAGAHYAQGIIRLWQHKNVDQAIADIKRAISFDPNFARAYGALGAGLHYAGRSEEGLRQFETMAKLDPHYPAPYHHFWAQAHFALGHFEEAVAALQARLAQQPNSDVSHVLLAASYGYLGRAKEARVEWEEALRVNPDYSIEERRQILPYKNPADFEHMIEGLRRAGISA